MPYRLASNAVWHSLPGVVSAYQPVGAPDAIAARQNIGWWHRMLGTYTASLGVAPTWAARTGWGLNGTTQYLNTAIIPPSNSWTMIVNYSGASGTSYRCLCGTRASTVIVGSFELWYDDGTPQSLYGNAGFLGTAKLTTLGTLGFAGKTGYKNGIPDGTLPAGALAATHSIYLGCTHNHTLGAAFYFLGTIRAHAIYNRTLTPAEMWLASMQMAYCEQNSQWNAWAAQRRYWIAPATTALRWPVIGSGIVGGQPVSTVQEKR